jgi:predicted DNA-binding transcriptional regulator AlpA
MASTENSRARLLSPQEVNERTGISIQTLANWRSQGRGPDWVKISGEIGKQGGRVGYPEDALDTYLRSRTTSPALVGPLG